MGAMTSPLPADHPPVKAPKTGVLLLNLGTPDGTTFAPMWRYLRQFLSDKRVIEVPRAIWLPILYGPILTFRPRKSGKAYAEIWDQERGDSPLRLIAHDQAEALRARMPDVEIAVGMRYGNPSTDSAIQQLVDAGCQRILCAALYPQYAASTTATAYDQVFRRLMKMRWQPAVRTLPSYHDDPAFIDALAEDTLRQLNELDFEPERLLTSYHGVPKSYLMKGDPYHCLCHKTTRLLAERMPKDAPPLEVTFQSRFGPAEWLKPYTDKTLEAHAKAGMKRVAVTMPGFSVDCLETLEEIGIGLAEEWHENGGTDFAALSCLNASKPSIDLIETLVRRNLSGWA